MEGQEGRSQNTMQLHVPSIVGLLPVFLKNVTVPRGRTCECEIPPRLPFIVSFLTLILVRGGGSEKSLVTRCLDWKIKLRSGFETDSKLFIWYLNYWNYCKQ